MGRWQNAEPKQKTAIVTDVSHTLLGISREEAQALPYKDTPSPSLYEKVFSLVHHQKRRWEKLSSKNSTGLSTAASNAVGIISADIP